MPQKTGFFDPNQESREIEHGDTLQVEEEFVTTSAARAL
jgi:hypothetical protein